MIKKIQELFQGSTLKSYIVHLAIIASLCLLMVLVFFFVYLPSATNHGETITVPNLEGMALSDLDDFLARRNLRYEIADSGYAAQYPPMTVLKQFPLQGSTVKEGRKIYLTIKANEPLTVSMPNLIDGSLKNAELVLKTYGLTRGSITYKPDLAANAVLDQMYEGRRILPGTKVRKGSAIDLIVGDGLGERIFDVPRFIGLPIDEANFSIRASGLNTGSVMINVIRDEQKPALEELAEQLEIESGLLLRSGYVFRQLPEIGAEIRLGQQVDLWVVSLSQEDSLDVLLNWINRGDFDTN